MRLRLTQAGPDHIQRSADVIVTLPDGSTPLAAVLRAAGVDPLPAWVMIDGHVAAADEPVGALALYEGSTVVLDATPGAATVPGGLAQLVQVAGGPTGRCVRLPVGQHDLGPATAAGRVEAPVVRIGVDVNGTLTVEPIGPGPIRLDGIDLSGRALEPVRGGVHIATSDAMFRIGPVPPAASARPAVPPLGPRGRVRYQRTPRPSLPATPPPPAPPRLPTTAPAAPVLSWAMVLAPIPVAVGMALLLSPHFLIFAAFSPLLAIARWAEGAWRRRRVERASAAERAQALREYEAALAAYAAQRAAQVRSTMPDLAALLEIAGTGEGGLWALRPGTPGYLQIPVGYGARPADWDVPPPADPAVHDLAAAYRSLPDVPITVDLDRHAGVGFVGPEQAADLAATAVAYAVATHGPAHLEVAVVCDADRLRRWDWLKWLPHLHDGAGRRTVATSGAEVAAIFDATPATTAAASQGTRIRAAADGPGPARLVVVHSESLLDAVLARLAAAPDRARTRICVVASAPERLPSICTQIALLRDGRLTVADLAEGSSLRGVLPAGADQAGVAGLGRRLARYVDPEAATGDASLPQTIDLAQVIGAGFETDDFRSRWAQIGPELLVTLGAAEDGPFVVDLIADGPHMLVAGTTGSGKSELLRTLVASAACRYGPDRLNFVLVDFKGGGAFDACTELPHTVGVVTDLDEHLAARALRCLRAELRHRERVLRAAGVSDLAELDGPDAPPRLVLMIDEFATLVNELPDFVGSLVDIAQRGRSLGIHLVLATQRPSGVVDGKIRANTNLRLALRVQSDADSCDVVGAPAAARVDRRTPGRGYALLGAGDLRAFQTALVSTQTPADGPQRVTVEPFTLDGATTAGAHSAAAPRPGVATDLQRIVDGSRLAAADRPAARVPWPDPLPDILDAEPLWNRTESVPGTVQLGLVDHPDAQRVDAFRWDHRHGPLAAYGLDPRATTGVVVTAAADLARRYPADALHLYLFDFLPGSGLERLDRLPHLAARIGAGELERMLRALDVVEREMIRRRDALRAGEHPGADAPLIMIGIAGYHHALAVAEELGRVDLPGRLERLVAEGSPLGIVSVLTTHHERGIPGRLASQVPTRIAFRLADPAAYASFGLRPRAVPDLRANRAVDLGSGEEVLIATPTVVASAGSGTGGPGPVQTLAERIPATTLRGHSRRDGAVWRLALGVRHSDLGTAAATLRPGEHLVVTGGSLSGRTTTLRTLVGSLRETGPVEVRVLTGRPEEWCSEPQVLCGAPALSRATGRSTLVVVDGLDAAIGADSSLAALADDPLVRIAVADRVDAFRLPAVWLRRVLASRTGILLQAQPDHGDLLRVRLPMRRAGGYPPGRGYLVENGVAELVQVALPADCSPGSASPDLATTMSVAACTTTPTAMLTATNV